MTNQTAQNNDWQTFTDARNRIIDQPVHRHGDHLVFAVEYEDTPGVVQCPRCGEQAPQPPPIKK